MDSFFSRYKNPLTLAVVLVAQFFLLAVQVRRPFPAAAAKVDQAGVRALRFGVTSVVTPPESVLHKSGLSVRGVWSSYLDLIGVREENTQLKQEVNQLRLEQAALAEDARQGERLQDLLAFRQHYITATVPAQVVGSSGTDRSHVLYLDKGSDDGIAADMPVITPDGIVGRVREVYPRTAQVLAINDPSSAAGVLLEETRTRGILRGSTRGEPQIVNLMPDDRIKPGQMVLTSGGDQIFPRGLPVGVVDHIAPDPDNEPMVDVVLKPAANLGRLEEVLVVTGTAAAPTERARRDLSKSEQAVAAAKAAKEAAAAAAAAAALADAQRASDVLAQRLPSRHDENDPYSPDASPDASPATSEAQAKPLHPPSALHPDHYTPGGVPTAESLTPGQRLAPLLEGTAATERRNAKAGDQGVNATDNAPVGTNPAFAGAAAAMAAQRKAAADAKAAAAAKEYAALHPGMPVAKASAEGAATPAASQSPVAVVRYTSHTNADGTVTRTPVPASTPLFAKKVNEDGTVAWVPATGASAKTPPAVQYTNRTNADGTVTRVPVPGSGPTAAAPLYMARLNADGTTTHVPVLSAAAPAASVRYVNRTNADGTVTRVAAPDSGTGASAAVRYVNRTNADGTITRVAVPAAPAVAYSNRLNADGTVTRVPAAGSMADVAGVRYTTRVNADGTTTRVAVPRAAAAVPGAAAAVRYTNRVNADGTVTRVPLPTASVTAAGSAQPRVVGGAGTAASVTTHVVADGPLPAGSRTAPHNRPAGLTPNTGDPRRVASPGPATVTGANGAAAAPKRKAAPVIVPDDGSRPPAQKTAPASTPPPQEQH